MPPNSPTPASGVGYLDVLHFDRLVKWTYILSGLITLLQNGQGALKANKQPSS